MNNIEPYIRDFRHKGNTEPNDYIRVYHYYDETMNGYTFSMADDELIKPTKAQVEEIWQASKVGHVILSCSADDRDSYADQWFAIISSLKSKRSNGEWRYSFLIVGPNAWNYYEPGWQFSPESIDFEFPINT